MQHFAVAATTTGAIPGAGVIVLIFCLKNFPIDDDIVHTHIAAAAVVGESDANFARGAGAGGIACHARRQSPRLNGAAADLQGDKLLAGYPARADFKLILCPRACRQGKPQAKHDQWAGNTMVHVPACHGPVCRMFHSLSLSFNYFFKVNTKHDFWSV